MVAAKDYIYAFCSFLLYFFTIYTFFVCSSTNAATLSEEIFVTVANIRSAKSYRDRLDSEVHLNDIVKISKNSDIKEEDIAKITSLLDMDDDMARSAAATALSYIGVRAKSAGPKLKSILSVEACKVGDLTSEAAIRQALISMGEKPPPDTCQEGKAGN